MSYKKIYSKTLIGLGTLVCLTSCGYKTTTGIVSQNDVDAEVLDESIVKELVDQKCSNVYAFDINKINGAQSNNKYLLILNGNIISNVNNGEQKGCITFSVNSAQYDVIKSTFKERPFTFPYYRDDTTANYDYFVNFYGEGSAEKLKDILNDKSTVLNSVKNLDTNQVIYSVDNVDTLSR
jgi:hypothetical protein